MHQTFYIDIDEEITSVVEKIKKARSSEIFIVVPRRALLIQSIVNLRILKKEADNLGVSLMIITQDKLGKMLIEKAGITVSQKMDDLSDAEIDLRPEERPAADDSDFKEKTEIRKEKDRLKKIGSSEYFDEKIDDKRDDFENEKMKNFPKIQKGEPEKIINKELVSGIACDIKKKSYSQALPMKEQRPIVPNVQINSNQDKKIENFFLTKSHLEREEKKFKMEKSEDFSLTKKTHRGFWFFGIVFAVCIILACAYFFIPNVKITIFTKNETESVDSEIAGDANRNSADYENSILPARLVEVQTDIFKKFEATGEKSVSNQKARGTITIYNNYDSNPQSLVATTRFLTDDGKLFRLIKGVTIPGMTGSGSEAKPGSIEAQVVADRAGEEFNIGQSKFKIPGFQNSGNDKYNKFYAESKSAMAGGGNSGGIANFVTASDISEAKTKMTADISEEIKQKLSEKSGGMLLVDGAEKISEIVFKSSNSDGDVADSFQMTASVKAMSIAVPEKEFKETVSKMIIKSSGIETGIESDSLALTFGKPNVDFDKKTITIKFHAVGKVKPDVDLEQIKKEILGKSEDDLTAYLGTFPDIEKAEMNYSPSFFSGRVPFRIGQVDLSFSSTLDK